MQLARYFHLLAAAAAFVEAAPAAVSSPQPLVQAGAPPSALGSPQTPAAVAANVERSLGSVVPVRDNTQVHKLAARNVITRLTRIRQDDHLLLASGVNLVVQLLGVGRNTAFSVPTLPAVANSLDVMGNTLGQHVAAATGVQLNGGQLLDVHWDTSNNVTPAITSLEWQTLLFAMYQVLPASGFDYVRATCSLGQVTLEILLELR